MLALEVELLTGRYVATSYSDRRRAEWPPHPARLFSALVATHHAEPVPDPAERAALLWLEQQTPPRIAATVLDPAEHREVVSVFVPVNDPTVTGDLDEDAAAVRQAEDAVAAAQGDKDRKATQRTLDAARKRLAQRMARAVDAGPTLKISNEAVETAASLLPDARMRQPRTFPSVGPDDPRVTFLWDAEPPAEHVEPLRHLLRRLVRLGHSSSLVRARIVPPASAPEPTYRPDAEGPMRLRVPRPDQLAILEEAFVAHRETEPRVMPAAFQRYTARPPQRTQSPPATVFSDDWIVLRQESTLVLPAVAAPGVARTIRRALMSYAEEPVPEVLSGHRSDGPPSERPHLAVVPLPYVGSDYADGRLLGVALVLPRDLSAEERRAVYRAVYRWEHEQRRGDTDEENPLLPVHLGPAGTWTLRRVEGLAPRQGLRPQTWCRPSCRWVSASPIALDRNPGDLRKSTAEAEEILVTACARAGLPRPVVTILHSVPLVGAAKARAYGPFSSAPGRVQRVLCHATLDFPSPVSGPLLLGAGRYLGLGLFRPVDEHE